MKILIIGSGGREHALAWKVAQSPAVEKVFVAPGNAGTDMEAKLENVAIDTLALKELGDFAERNHVALTIVGPEAPLVQGIVNYFHSRDLKCFGPSKNAAQLEGSKSFAKDFLRRHHIPTAAYETFSELTPALEYVKKKGVPIVIKADGLASGKGVVIAETLDQAERTLRDMLSDNAFGEAGHKIVIEEFLEGEEASFIVMVDGKHILPMATSQDHKRIGDNDTGLNTGGMGAYSPAPVVTADVHRRIVKEIIEPTVKGMAVEGNDYTGFLYAGLMIAPDGAPKVIEYNCRFGDPETQPVMMRLQSDLADLCLHALDGTLDQCTAIWDERPAVGIVLAATGYPQSYRKGYIVSGLSKQENDYQKIFHAGTALKNHQIVTNGGRVLCATALGDTVTKAQQAAYELAQQIQWDGVYYRKDIAYRAIYRERNGN
ncbi:MAG: phosphoribosylamine--glycine ligase [Cellvibrionaceae bacterium]|jgi:phosphoribosylamine--glycine ligase